MKKNILILLIVLFFTSIISSTHVYAQSASCLYYENEDGSSNGWYFKVDIHSNMTLETKLWGSIEYNHLLATSFSNLFLKNDILHCPKYARLKEENGEYGTRYRIMLEDGTNYKVGYGYKALTRDDESYVEYNAKKYYYDEYPNGPEVKTPAVSEVTVVKECSYGDSYTFTIKSDETVSGYRPGYIVTIYDTKKIFTKDSCPKDGELFIETGTRDGKYYADVYTEERGGTSSPDYDPDREKMPTPDVPVPDIPEHNCTSLLGDPSDKDTPSPAFLLTYAFKIIRYVAIVLLVVMSIMDFIESVSSQDKDSMNKAISKTVRRIIYCVLIFLLPSLLEFILTLLNDHAVNICINS